MRGISRSSRIDVGPPLRDRLERRPPVRGGLDLAGLVLEQLAHQVGHVRIVVDHEQAPAARGDALQGGEQVVALERLHQVVGGAQPVAQVLLVDHAEQQHRDVARRGIRLQPVQHLPAVGAAA